jgi:hypothetical protein
MRRIDEDAVGKVTFSTFSDAILPSDSLSIKAPIAEPIFRRSVSPVRRTITSSFYSPSKAASNLDYLDYVHESARKSPIRGRSPIKREIELIEAIYSSPSRRVIEEIYASPRRISSPFRSSIRASSPLRTSSPSRIIIGSPMKGNEETHLALNLKE